MTTVDAKWWLTADGSRAVPDGDPEAAVLYATPGDQVPDEDAERLGILEPKPKAKAKGGSKQKVTAEDAAIGSVEEAAEEA